MAKVIKYQFLQNEGGELVLSDAEVDWNEANETIAKQEAYNGVYTIEDDKNHPIAPRNIVSGEYVTIANVLYRTIGNIPNGEPIIEGQNAIKTTVEEQLCELAKGE